MSSYTKYSNEILDTIVLNSPLFLSHRIIAFTPDAYFTFTKTGEDQTHILNAIKTYVFPPPLNAHPPTCLPVRGQPSIMPT